MDGLLMMRLYADEILSGRTDYDARLYPTDRRGTIAIVDSSTFRIYGTAELVSVREIPYEEFRDWHRIGPFKETEIAPYHEGKVCYAYDLRNVRKLPLPVQIPKVKNAGMWVTVPERTANNLFSQQTLF